MLSNLERFVQLHQNVEIIYVVDGYEASYLVADGQRVEREARGATILEALQNLQASLMDNPPKWGGPKRPFRCENCRDQKQWISPDNGQVVTCAYCNKGGK